MRMKSTKKNLLLLLIFMLSFSPSILNAQAPQSFKYQAVLRDDLGNILSNQSVGLRVSIREGVANGPIIYQETFTVNTNIYGLVNLNIGLGMVDVGNFSVIEWGANAYFMQIEVNPGSGYINMGSTQLLSVPYALYAENAGVPGLPGPTGATGDQGIQGPTGEQGITGPTGATGTTGIQGEEGLPGITGSTGPAGAQGIKGDDGIQGAEGATGPTGPQGPTGAQGTQGAQGATGTTGPTGLQGEQGVSGPTGHTGTQGITGPSGPTGEQGAQGNDGNVGPTGPQGIQGPAGSTGEQGPAGIGLTNKGNWLSGFTYAPNDYVFASSSSNPLVNSMWIVQHSTAFVSNTEPKNHTTHWVEFEAPSGPTGAQGPTGPTGAQGVTGATGQTGGQGLQGIQGPIGPTGLQGTQGIQGVQGIQGNQGIQGPAGPTGAQGEQGVAGVTGTTGATGTTGVTGATGPLIAGTENQTLRHNGNTWIADDFLKNNGSNIGINAIPNTKHLVHIYRNPGECGADSTGLYVQRRGASGSTVGGISFANSGIDAAIKGYSYWGNPYSAAIAGYSWLDYANSVSIIGGNNSGTLWGALAYKDTNNISWAGYFKGNANVTGLVRIQGGNPGLNKVLVSDANGEGSWQDIASLPGGSKWTVSTNNIYRLTGRVGIGVSSPNTGLHLNHDDGFLATGTYNSGWNGGNLGAGARMMWIPRKGAFRAGSVSSNNWNSDSIGAYSFAVGYNTMAKGTSSTAIGYFSVATTDEATAIGSNALASGFQSLSLGTMTTSSGDYSTAIGYWADAKGNNSFSAGYSTRAQSFASTAMGSNNVSSGNASSWIATDPLFVIGNANVGSSASNALTILKNGRLGLQSVTAPTYALELPNNSTAGIGKARAFEWATYSDGRLKTNRNALSYGLNEILKISALEYTHHNSKIENDALIIEENGKKDIGFIAQDVYKIIPEMVNRPENEAADLWSINYEKLTPVLVKAIQEQQLLIEKLLQQNLELIKRIETLEKK